MNTDLMFSSATPEHFTPPWILDLVEKVGPIGLDPCAHPKSEAFKRARIAIVQDIALSCTAVKAIQGDGLMFDWAPLLMPDEMTFTNTPYGRELARWAAKMAKEDQCAIVALVPARVDTGWWRELDPIAWCALAGRLKFWSLPKHEWGIAVLGCIPCLKCGLVISEMEISEHPACPAADPVEADNSAPFPSAVCLLHAHHLRDRFVEVFSPYGPVYGRL